MAKGAGPLVDAGFDLLELPKPPMLVGVVVLAEWFEMSGRGAVGFGPGMFVVEVGLGGGHPAPREDTCRVSCFDLASLGGSGSSSGGGDGDRLALVVGDRDPPL